MFKKIALACVVIGTVAACQPRQPEFAPGPVLTTPAPVVTQEPVYTSKYR
ncbi:MAG: hypothetical protein Q4G36_06655 [Paracoccus sp. (in: a-proteobacteria)]|nr:hypothetical protein [Paracoccus sp. (in: a-proteobacteria)]